MEAESTEGYLYLGVCGFCLLVIVSVYVLLQGRTLGCGVLLGITVVTLLFLHI